MDLRSILVVSAALAVCSCMLLLDALWAQRCGNDATWAGCGMRHNAPLLQSSPTPEPSASRTAMDLDATTRAIFTSPPGVSHKQVIPVDAHHSSAEQAGEELRLAFEADYTGADTFNYVNVSNLLYSEDFTRQLDQFAGEAKGDEDAVAQTHVYRQIAEQVIHISGMAMHLSNFTCGIRICIGEIAGGNKDSYAEWAVGFHHKGELGVGFQRMTLTTPSGEELMRFLFYADPAPVSRKDPSAVGSEG